MKGKKLLAGILSVVMALCTMAISAFAESSTTTSTVTVKGVAGFEDKQFETIQEAYNEISPEIGKLAGFSEQTCSDENFNNVYTDNGRITWTITGKQIFSADDNVYLFTFGRAAARYNDNSYITAVNIIGGDDNSELILEKNVRLPYDWWGNVNNELSADFSHLTISASSELGNISTVPNYGYKLNISYNDCIINGNFYSYWDKFDLNLTFNKCRFNAPENTQYAIFAQGSGTGAITVNECSFTNYTRGVNFQKPNTAFNFTNNIIKSDVSELDRGAVQITDGTSFVVKGNTIDVSGGNAFWFHSAATNINATYTISENNIKAPYLVNDDTTFGVNNKIISYGNSFNDTDTVNCMEKAAAEPTKSTVTVISANGWTTDTDAGFYKTSDGKKYGMMRFMFSVVPNGTVTEAGIKYVNADNLSAEATAENTVSASGEIKAFQGDIVGISTDVAGGGAYYALAYVKTEKGEFWSNPVRCSVDWTQYFTDYTPGGAN